MAKQKLISPILLHDLLIVIDQMKYIENCQCKTHRKGRFSGWRDGEVIR